MNVIEVISFKSVDIRLRHPAYEYFLYFDIITTEASFAEVVQFIATWSYVRYLTASMSS